VKTREGPLSRAGVIIGGRAHNLGQAREVGELGLPFAEISLDHGEQAEGMLAELLELRERYGLSYIAHYPNEGNPFDADALKRDFVPRIKGLVDVSEKLGIEKATIHFWMDRRWAPADLVPKKIALLDEMATYAADKGLVLCLENLSERFDSFLPAFEAIPCLRMTLDIGHAQLLSSRNTSFGFIENTFERIAHLHVHDNNGGTSVRDDLHLPLGQGSIDYRAIFGELKLRGYASTVTMEIKPRDMPGTGGIIEQYLRP
jgi:sugar phosphate isomerase/epimerase